MRISLVVRVESIDQVEIRLIAAELCQCASEDGNSESRYPLSLLKCAALQMLNVMSLPLSYETISFLKELVTSHPRTALPCIRYLPSTVPTGKMLTFH